MATGLDNGDPLKSWLAQGELLREQSRSAVGEGKIARNSTGEKEGVSEKGEQDGGKEQHICGLLCRCCLKVTSFDILNNGCHALLSLMGLERWHSS